MSDYINSMKYFLVIYLIASVGSFKIYPCSSHPPPHKKLINMSALPHLITANQKVVSVCLAEEKKTYNLSAQTMYLEVCKTFGLIPVKYFLNNVHSTHLKMRHHGLGAQGAFAISVPLLVRSYG